jgi:hypothetical protein
MSSSPASRRTLPAVARADARSGVFLPLAVRRLDRPVFGLELFKRAWRQAVATMDRGHRRVWLDDHRAIFSLLDDDVLAGEIAAEGDVGRALGAHDKQFRRWLGAARDGSIVEALGPSIVSPPAFKASSEPRKSGETRVLANNEPTMHRRIWVDPTSYLPVRMTAHGQGTSYVIDYTWIPRSEQTVAATFAPHIPPGFTKVSQLPGS